MDAAGPDLTVRNDFPLSASDITGSILVARPKRWEWWGGVVLGMTGNVINLEQSYGTDWRNKYGFIFVNKHSFLEPGTWYFDSTTSRLYMWMINNEDPNNFNIIVNNHDYGIFIDHCKHVIVEDFKIQYTKSHGVRISGGEHVTVKDMDISRGGEDGISGSGNNYTIIGNVVTDMAWRGMYIQGRSNLIENNRVENIFLNPFSFLIVPGSPRIGGHGIMCRQSSNKEFSIVKRNYLKNIGYNALSAYGSHIKVIENYAENGCMFTDDCGLIYQWRTSYTQILRNIIINSIGNNYGTPSFFNAEEMEDVYSHSAQGIYLDDGSGNNTVKDNVVINIQYGVFFHNAQYNEVSGNIVYKARQHAILAVEDTIWDVKGWTKENYVENNYLHIISKKYATIRMTGNLGWVNMTTTNNNWYTPYNQNQLFAQVYDGSTQHYYPTMKDYQKKHNNDKDSKYLGGGPNKNTWYDIVQFVYKNVSSNLIKNGNFESNKNDWGNGWSDPGGHVTTEWSSDYGGSIKSYIDKVGTKSRGDILTTSSRFEVFEDRSYAIKYTFVADRDDDLTMIVRRCLKNYTVVGFNQLTSISNNPIDFEFVFNANQNESDACMYVHSGLTIGSTYHVDNVSIHEVNVKRNDIEDDFTVIYNSNTYGRWFYVWGLYCDVNGNVVPWWIYLEPYEGRFLVNCFCNNDNVCNNFENANSCPNDCKPVCGNLVCEYATENMFNCPTDCFWANGAVFYFVLSVCFVCFLFAIIIAIVVVIVIIYTKVVAKKKDIGML